ncbi:MAG: hypothetical protein AB7E79_16520 [Rhodospirillaceae bacterium]
MSVTPPRKMRVQILDEMQGFMRRHNASLGAWKVGTAVSALAEMTERHGFKTTDIGLYRKAASADDAASIVSYFIRRGAAGEGASKPGAVYVYALLPPR